MMSNQGNSGSETTHGTGILPGCPVTPSKSTSLPDSVAGGTQDTTDTESVPCLSPAPSCLSLQQTTNPGCLKTNQGFQAVSCLTAELTQPLAAKNLHLQTDQTSQQQHGPLQQQQAQDSQAVQHAAQHGQQLQQGQLLQPNNHLQQGQQLPQNPQQLQQNPQQLQQNQQQLQQNPQQLQQNTQQLQQNQQQQLQQNQQQLQQNQQQLQMGQQLHQGSHMQSTGLQLSQVQQLQPGQQNQQLQLQHPLQLQQGQQLLQQQQTQHMQQLLQQQQNQNQHQQGQQLLQSQQQQQVQQMLQHQQSQQQQGQQHHNQQLLQHVDQQQQQSQQQLLHSSQGQEFFQQQGQPLLQQQQTSQQQLHQQYQQQMQHGQRFLQQPGQHLLPQQSQQQLLSQQQGQQQLLQPLQQQQQLNQQQLLQQVGQQQLLSSLQSSGQQLYQAMQSGQPGLFQPQSGQQLLQTSLMQSQPNQALMQQQPFQVNQQQLLQQQTQQQIMQQQQQLSNLQQQIVLQAIQAQGSGSGVNLSNMTGRSLSIMPSGSSIGLVNTVPANVYRQIVSSVGQGSSTTTLATQISKSNPVAGSRAVLSQPSTQRPAAMQVIQPRQNTPLFIGQFGMVSNGAIIPSGIVPLTRPQVSGSVTVQATGAQPQILGSPTQVQLTTPLLGSAGNMLNPQTLQAAMAQLQQQQGTTLLTSQPLYIQPGISISHQTDGTGTPVTVAKSTTPLSSSHLSGLSISLPVQIAIGASGLTQGLQTRPISWPAVTTTMADKNIFSLLPSDANQLKVAALPTSSHDLTLLPLMEPVVIDNRGLYSNVSENCGLRLGSEINVASLQGYSSGNCLLSTSGRHDGVRPEKSHGLSGSMSDTSGGHALAKVSGLSEGMNAVGEKQTATVKPQILTHVIEGFVIQEGSEPFPVQPSSFMSEFLDSTDEMTDSSCDGQSDEETPEDKTKTTTGMSSQTMHNSSEVEHPLGFAKNSSQLCTYCNKHYELPAFGRTGKFCSQSCAKRSAASSRWNLYHVNKSSETPVTNKTPVKRRSSNTNGRGWIRSSGNRNLTNAAGTHQKLNQTPPGALIAQSPISNLHPSLPKSSQQQQSTVSHGPRLSSDNGTTSGEHDASYSFQQRMPPVPLLLASPRREVTPQSPVPTGDCQVRDSDPTRKHPSEWGVQEVYSFVKSLPGCSGYAEEFRLQEIDGQALLLLKEDHLMTTLNLKLGPALKICQQIMALKDSLS